MEADLLGHVVSTLSGLFVALLAVWIRELWSDHREFRSMIRALKDEIEDHARLPHHLNLQIGMGLDAIKKGQVLMLPFVRLYDSAWVAFKTRGFLVRLDSELARNLKEVYASCSMLNDFSRRQEEITFTPPNVPPKTINRMRKDNLEVMHTELVNLGEKIQTVSNPLEKLLDC
jgi:hypothetical protein